MSRRLKARARPSSMAAASCFSSSVISSGELSTRGQPPSSRTRARTRSGNASAVFRATKPPMECPSRTASSQTEVVEDADHVGRRAPRGRSPTPGLSESPRPRRSTPTRPRDGSKVACRSVEGPVLGGDAVQADDGVRAFSRRARSRALPRRGRVLCFQTSSPWAGDYTRRRSEERVMVIYR